MYIHIVITNIYICVFIHLSFSLCIELDDWEWRIEQLDTWKPYEFFGQHLQLAPMIPIDSLWMLVAGFTTLLFLSTVRAYHVVELSLWKIATAWNHKFVDCYAWLNASYIYIYLDICWTTLLQCSLWNWKRSQLSSLFQFWHAKPACWLEISVLFSATSLVKPSSGLDFGGPIQHPPHKMPRGSSWIHPLPLQRGPMVLNDDELVDNVSGALRCSICLNVFTEPAAWRKICSLNDMITYARIAQDKR
jgi:hypothetical protein